MAEIDADEKKFKHPADMHACWWEWESVGLKEDGYPYIHPPPVELYPSIAE
jgi:hypothetical protein